MSDIKSKQTTITTPDYALKNKLGKDVNLRDVFTPDRIAASQKEIAKVQDSFLDNAKEKLEEMQRAFGKTPDKEATRELLISSAFLLKGQAESLGYILFALTAKSLCEYCEKHLSTDLEHREVILNKHFDTMLVVIKDKIKGEGGEVGKALVKSLKLLVSKYHP